MTRLVALVGGGVLLAVVVMGVYARLHSQPVMPVAFTQQPTPTATPVSLSDKSIIGTWQSTDDTKSIVVFASDGTFQDSYDKTDVATGTWLLRTDLNGTEFAGLGAGTYLQKKDTTDQLTLYYSVDVVGKTLGLTYLPRGNTLSYIRLK